MRNLVKCDCIAGWMSVKRMHRGSERNLSSIMIFDAISSMVFLTRISIVVNITRKCRYLSLPTRQEKDIFVLCPDLGDLNNDIRIIILQKSFLFESNLSGTAQDQISTGRS